MNVDRGIVRARIALGEWFVLVVVVLLALALFGGWMAAGVVGDDTENPDLETIEAWTQTAGFDHAATVTTENEVYEVGEVLEHQRTYFTEIAPALSGTFEYRYDAPDGDVDVTVSLERVVRSLDGDGEPYWSTAETLNETSPSGLAPGETHETPFDLEVAALENETSSIESSLGGSAGTVETLVVATVTTSGEIDGEAVERTDRYELFVDVDGATYTVDGPTDERHAEERTEEVAAGPNDGDDSALVGIVVLFGTLGSLGALVWARRTDRLVPSADECARVQRATERARFDEWISRGVLSPEIVDRPRVQVDSLADLVDVAIDCESRVIESRPGDDARYAVVDDGVLYTYDPPIEEYRGEKPRVEPEPPDRHPVNELVSDSSETDSSSVESMVVDTAKDDDRRSD